MSDRSFLSLGHATEQTIIYVASFLFLIGLIGNCLTLLVVVSLKTFRQSSCSFY
jgi:hypothetical protein